MITRPLPRLWYVALAVASVAVLLGSYTALSARQRAANPRDTTIPGWSQMAAGLARAVTPQGLGKDVWLLDDGLATAGRLAAGMAGGVVLGVGLGMLMGCFPPAEAALLPPVAFLAKIPPTAMLAIFFALVPLGRQFFTATIAFGVAPVLAQTVFEAVRVDVPPEMLDTARTLGASRAELVLDVIWPQILPRLIESARLQLGPALVYLVAAEWLASDVGFGYRRRLQSRLLDMSVVYPYLAILGAFGFALDRAFTLARRTLCPWTAR